MKRSTLLMMGGAAALTLSLTALACGPSLTAAFLSDARNMLNIPEVYLGFSFRSVRHQPEPPPPLKPAATATKFWEQSLPCTLEVDVADLRRVLSNSTVPENERAELLAAYENLRWDQLTQWEDAEMRSLPRGEKRDPIAIPRPTWIGQHTWPNAIPAEFRLYAEGVHWLHARNTGTARDEWLELLKLPLEQRHERSAWAAWMLMKTAATPEDATHWLQEVCRVVEQEGCADSLRMHPAALALLASQQSPPAGVKELALQYLNAKANERRVYQEAMEDAAFAVARSDDAALKMTAAKDPAAREIITSVLAGAETDIDGSVDDPGVPFDATAPHILTLKAWAKALLDAGVSHDPVMGELGIALYRVRHFDLSRQYLALGTATWETLWIQSKLELQRGHTREAAETMARALRLFPAAEKDHLVSVTETVWDRNENGERMDDAWFRGVRNSRFLAECATLRLSQADFSSALKLFLEADCPHDAAYVAEHLMTPDELLAYIRNNGLKRNMLKPVSGYPEDEDWRARGYYRSLQTSPTNTFLYVAARALARAQYFQQARPFYPPEVLPFFDRYVTLYRRGHSRAVQIEVRAHCLMEAARWHRWRGMELFGAEGDPDGTMWDGDFPYDALSEFRANLNRGLEHFAGMENNDWVVKYRKPAVPLNTCGFEEVRRLKSNSLWNKPRFHYRVEAFEMAREAAHLLPNNSEEAARMLAESGLWIPTNEHGLDPFFEELITRYRKTTFAQACDQQRWVPGDFIEKSQSWTSEAALQVPVPGD